MNDRGRFRGRGSFNRSSGDGGGGNRRGRGGGGGRGWTRNNSNFNHSERQSDYQESQYKPPPIAPESVVFDEDAWIEEEPAPAPTHNSGRSWQNGSQSSHWGNSPRESREDNSFRFGRGASSRADRDTKWRNKDRPPESAPTVITISSRDVGKVIGRGGAKIRELQDNSGARIKIGEQDRDETEISLFGSEEATQKAKELIEDFLGNYYGNNSNANVEKEKPRGPIDWGAALKECENFQKERWSKCPPLVKSFYAEDHEIACWHPEEVAQFRKQNNNIAVMHMDDDDTRPIPNPVQTFEQAFSNYPEILDTIYEQNFDKPSPIQCQAWPIVLQGIDLIGIAQTGTGKTIAFLLPAFIHIENQPVPRSERGGPNVLILAPTRELALQIEKEARKYRYKDIKSVCIYGGGSRREQVNVVTKGVEIVIATPGRLNDLVMAGVIDVSSITMLILDEADRMLDMGFEPQIRKILLDVRPDRHTIMTSATWPEAVRRLATNYMSKPMMVFIGTLDLAAVHSVHQTIMLVDQEEKREKLYEFIQKMEPDDKVIVFVGKKAVADDLASELLINNIVCQSIHGDREQCDRIQALEDLASGEVRILIATDVASRGIDIKDITHIFNMDFPRNIEEYVHRVGRTGRAGRTGESITLMTRSDWHNARELIDILSEAGQEVPYELEAMAERYEAWKEKRDTDREQIRESRYRNGGGRGGGGGGGGRRGRW